MNHALAAAMTEAGLTAESLASLVGCDPKTVQRWTNPGRTPQPRHRAQVAEQLGRTVADLWPEALRRREPLWFRPWVDVERAAVSLRWYELAWVPGLLQTERYARATLHGEALSADEIERLVAGRMDRQAILHRDQPPLLTAVIDESVLRRTAYGDRELMREQCAHLAEMAQLPLVQLHVVPAGVGMYPGLGGAFIVAELPDSARMAHTDGQGEASITPEVATLDRRWEVIRSEALPRQQSLDLIKEAAQTWT